ncbi:MAG: hypothetical protein RLZ98_591 [Pseudomonadota bacterium]|jgi:pyrroloquinoline quinone (PQQ) biosynthesis protein C
MSVAESLNPSLDLKPFAVEVRRRAIAQFDTPQYKRLLATPLTRKRSQVYVLQKSFWNLNRRDCWAFAQALSPMSVKKLIWEHEEDELAGNKDRGVEDHYSLQVRQSSEIGLTADDFRNEEPREGTRMACYAWLHLVKDSHWLKSVAACAALEVSNSSEWVPEGGMSYRWGKKMEKDLGIPFEKQLNAKEHAEVDVEHAHMLMDVARMCCKSQADLDVMMQGMIESWQLDRAWKGILADMLAECPDK